MVHNYMDAVEPVDRLRLIIEQAHAGADRNSDETRRVDARPRPGGGRGGSRTDEEGPDEHLSEAVYVMPICKAHGGQV